MVRAISQLPNKFHGHFATPLEYVISLTEVHSFTSTNLSDIDNIVPFRNTTPINRKKVKINTEQVDNINQSAFFQMVQCCPCKVNMIQ